MKQLIKIIHDEVYTQVNLVKSKLKESTIRREKQTLIFFTFNILLKQISSNKYG